MERDTQESTVSGSAVSIRQTISDSVFSDSFNAYVYKKCERLSVALYLVTEHFGDEEPLKWSIRQEASRLPSGAVELSAVDRDLRERSDTLELHIVTLSSLIETGFMVKLVSETNCRMILREFNLLYESLRTKRLHRPSESSALGDAMFFDIGYPAPITTMHEGDSLSSRSLKVSRLKSFVSHTPQSADKGHSKGHTRAVAKSLSGGGISGSLASGRMAAQKGGIDVPESESMSRAGIIIRILGARKDASAKDILEFFTDCGEKTLQRELGLLVRTGRVAKRGERRWSRYSLREAV